MVSLGPECRAPGARIVLEAKEDSNCDAAQSVGRNPAARKNRGAQIGIFVFSAKTAVPSLEPFARFGDDLIVIWNAEDVTSDVYLKAALTTARALCVRSAEQSERHSVDLEAVDRAILEIEEEASRWRRFASRQKRFSRPAVGSSIACKSRRTPSNVRYACWPPRSTIGGRRARSDPLENDMQPA